MKGQIQIGESIMVIIILTILGVFLLSFYAKMAGEDFKTQVGEIDRLNALETAQAASSLYELTCSKPGVTYVCFDIHKTVALSKFRQLNSELVTNYYQSLFGNAKITISAIYPSQHDYIIYWNNATNPNPESPEESHQGIIPVVIPVVLHNSSSNTNMFGIYTVESYT